MEHTDHEQQLKDEEAMELGLEMLKDMVLKYWCYEMQEAQDFYIFWYLILFVFFLNILWCR